MVRATPCADAIPPPRTDLAPSTTNAAEASSLFARLYAKMFPKGYTAKARDAVDYYKGTGYVHINKELRKPGYLQKRFDTLLAQVGPDAPVWKTSPMQWPENVAKAMDELDRLVTKNMLTEDMLVYRGLSSAKVYSAPVGATFSDAGFASTSIHRPVAEAFAQRAPKTGVVLEIEAPAGTRGAFVTNLDPAFPAGEFEFLMPRGTTYQVIANDGAGTIRVRIVEMD